MLLPLREVGATCSDLRFQRDLVTAREGARQNRIDTGILSLVWRLRKCNTMKRGCMRVRGCLPNHLNTLQNIETLLIGMVVYDSLEGI